MTVEAQAVNFSAHSSVFIDNPSARALVRVSLDTGW